MATNAWPGTPARERKLRAYAATVHYTRWVGIVFPAVGRASDGAPVGVGVAEVATALGLTAPTREELLAPDGPGHALMTALDELSAMRLIEFPSTDYGIRLTSNGRDTAVLESARGGRTSRRSRSRSTSGPSSRSCPSHSLGTPRSGRTCSSSIRTGSMKGCPADRPTTTARW